VPGDPPSSDDEECRYTLAGADHLMIAGVLRGANRTDAQIRIDLRRLDETAFSLKSRGIHWVTEAAFNR
jgi:hypothetical protein